MALLSISRMIYYSKSFKFYSFILQNHENSLVDGQFSLNFFFSTPSAIEELDGNWFSSPVPLPYLSETPFTDDVAEFDFISRVLNDVDAT